MTLDSFKMSKRPNKNSGYVPNRVELTELISDYFSSDVRANILNARSDLPQVKRDVKWIMLMITVISHALS